MTDDLPYLSAVDAVAGYRVGSLSPLELTRAVLDRIERQNERYRAYTLVDADHALAVARASEMRWRKRRPLGLLDGVPIAIKDLILTRGWPTLRGSRAISVEQRWDVDAPSTRLLRNAGAVLIGKTTTPELGWKAVTDGPLTGVTTNPWDKTRTSGGSSGGSAVAVALGMAALAMGTDGGGSIRIPASFTSIVGFKPTFGRVPIWPVSPFGSLSHAGPMTRTVSDAALMMNVIARSDSSDWQSLPDSGTDYMHALEGSIADVRVAYSPNLGYGVVDPEVAAAVEAAAHTFEALGARVEEVDPGFADPLETFTVLWYAGAAQALLPFDDSSRSGMDPGLLEIAAEGARYSAMRYLEAVMQRGNLGVHMSRFHDRFDLLLTPSVPIPAFEAGREVPPNWPHPRWPTWTPFSFPFNLTQQPAISVPCGFTSSNLPIGLQIVGGRYQDALVLRAARAYQDANPLHTLWQG